MKNLFRIKWELIMLLLNLLASGTAWFTYFYTKETNVLVMGIATLICLVAIICSYKTIANIRKTAYRMY